MLDEVSLTVIEFFPIFDILSKINLFGGPECGNLVLVHLPDIIIFNWQNNKSVGIFFQERLWHGALSLCIVAVL